MDNKSVKKNIRESRHAAGLSQAEMADRLGLSKTAYNNLESGGTKLISGKVEMIAEVLNTSAEKLVLGYEPVPKTSGRLKDMTEEFDVEKARIINDYEDQLEKLRKQFKTLNEYVELLKDSNRTKDEIISMLKKELAKSGK